MENKNRHKIVSAVFLVLLREENTKKQVLLQLRQNTGYMDGRWDLGASGHVEENELIEDALVRETKEEIGIIIDKKDIKFVHFRHWNEENYFNFFFACDKYEGVPKIMETEKCAELKWFDLDNLPNNLTEHNKLALESIKKGDYYEITTG